MLQNLAGKPLPGSLVSQLLPGQWDKVRRGQIANSPEVLILDKVVSVLEDYAFACGAG
jgi:D-tagatose-1,6-bisphosphate aldolase subunit GatZ/KbaZ